MMRRGFRWQTVFPLLAFLPMGTLQAQTVELAKLLPGAGGSNGFVGKAVSLSGDRALVGAGTFPVGSAYVFDRQPDGSWIEATKLLASDVTANFFGSIGLPFRRSSPRGSPR